MNGMLLTMSLHILFVKNNVTTMLVYTVCYTSLQVGAHPFVLPSYFLISIKRHN